MTPQDDLTAERAVSLEVRKALAEKVKGLLLNGLTHEENQIWLANVDAFENRAYQRGRQEALREAASLIKLMPMLTAHNVAAVLDRLASEGA